MSAVIRSGQHPLAELVSNPADYVKVGQRLADTVLASFGTDRQRNPFATAPTMLEVKYRTEVALRWFKVMRRDMHYALTHALDLLPTALRAELDGLKFEPPPAGRMWGVQGAERTLEFDGSVLHDGSTVKIDEETGRGQITDLPELPRDHEAKD